MSGQLLGREPTSIHRHVRSIFPRRLELHFLQAMAQGAADVTVIGNGGEMNHNFRYIKGLFEKGGSDRKIQ